MQGMSDSWTYTKAHGIQLRKDELMNLLPQKRMYQIEYWILLTHVLNQVDYVLGNSMARNCRAMDTFNGTNELPLKCNDVYKTFTLFNAHDTTVTWAALNLFNV